MLQHQILRQESLGVIVPASSAERTGCTVSQLYIPDQATLPPSGPYARAIQKIRTTNHVGRLCCTRALQTELQEAQLDSASRAHCSAA